MYNSTASSELDKERTKPICLVLLSYVLTPCRWTENHSFESIYINKPHTSKVASCKAKYPFCCQAFLDCVKFHVFTLDPVLCACALVDTEILKEEWKNLLVLGQLSESDIPMFMSVLFSKEYFVSRTPASWPLPTLGLLRAYVRVLQLGLSLVVNQVFSISKSWSLGSENCALILSSVPLLTLSWSPRGYHCAATSITASSTWPRSSEVSVFPKRSRNG